MPVHFCPRCGRLNLADFSYCPYCGEPVSRGPGLEEALEGPLKRLEKLPSIREGAVACMERRMAEIRADLDALEEDMEEFMAQGRRRTSGEGSDADAGCCRQ